MWYLMSTAIVSAALSAGTLPAATQRSSRPDLVQVQVLVPKKVTIGKAFRVMDRVENQGESPALDSVTYFYLSQDDEWDEKDILVGGRRVPQLGNQRSHEQITPVTLKADIAPGNYFFLAVADARHQVEERYEDNNTRAVPILVLPAEK